MVSLAILLGALAACDPVAAVSVNQSLRPAPAGGCVPRALASSPLVSRMSRVVLPYGAGYMIEVRDSTAVAGRRAARVQLTDAAADSA